MKTWARFAIAGMFLSLLFYSLVHLIRNGIYGLTVFVLFPFLAGAAAAWVFRPSTKERAVTVGAGAILAGALLLLIWHFEGAVCIAMTLPLALPLGILGACVTYWAQNWRARRIQRAGAMLVLLPLATLGWDSHARPATFAVHTSVEVAAPPEVVWKHVVTFSALPEPQEWYFRAGIAYPKRARIHGTGPGAIRLCEFSTGPFVEPIDVWDEPRLLAFHVTANPAPLEEWTPFGPILTRHLHGYLVSKHGQFRLSPLPGNRTLLEGTTWYQHGLWPSSYWRLWSDAIIHRIHLRVLNHVRTLAEHDAA